MRYTITGEMGFGACLLGIVLVRLIQEGRPDYCEWHNPLGRESRL